MLIKMMLWNKYSNLLGRESNIDISICVGGIIY